ncbi:MAG: cation:proton antiporter [Richelia sp.]|nr:cation:proton antiporter [Richelia sp.]
MDLILQVLALQSNSSLFGKEPILPFVILLLVILFIPILFERLRLPGLVGLVLAGITFGQSGGKLLPTQSPIMELLADIGLFYLMFVAGLEIEIKQFRNYKNRFLGFGSLTFVVPLTVGVVIAFIFGLNWKQAILIGSVLASHTLLAYPIINRLGISRNEVVNVTTGATVVTNIGAVLLLAVCVAARGEEFQFWRFITLVNSVFIYCLVILLGFERLGKEFFRRSGEDEGNHFLFVLWTVFLAGVGAQIIGVEAIVGAFLAGLTVHNAIGSGPVKDKVIFLGSALFIPIFFVKLGMLVNVSTLITSASMVWFTVFVIVGLITSKLIAALLAKLLYRYNWQEMLTMWSLSVPQVGVTLAATFVGYRSGLLDINVFNSLIILVIVTCIIGPLITNQVATGLKNTLAPDRELKAPSYPTPRENVNPFTIVVPTHNPQTQQYLIEIAALLARQTHGQIVPLAIATATAQMDAPTLENSVHRSEQLLAKAIALSQVLEVRAKPLLRIDDAFAQGISRAAKEQKANLIVMGWGKRTGLRARLFGNVIDSVIWSSHCPVAVTRLVESPQKIQRILVPVENLPAPSLYPVQFAQILAETNQAQVTVLNVCERRTSSNKISERRSQLSSFVFQMALANPPEIQIIAHENVAQAILQAARLYDLVVLPFIRNPSSAGGLTIGDVTSQLANQLTCSIVMLGEPHNPPAVMVSDSSPSPIPTI